MNPATAAIPAVKRALAAAGAAQVVIAVLGDTASGYGKGTCAEGIDADTLDLPGSQLPLLAALVAQVRLAPAVLLTSSTNQVMKMW